MKKKSVAKIVKLILDTIKWSISIFLVMAGIICVAGSLFSGIFLFLCALLINPIFEKIWIPLTGKKIKWYVKTVLVLIFFIVGVSTSRFNNGESETSNLYSTISDTSAQRSSEDVSISIESSASDFDETNLEVDSNGNQTFVSGDFEIHFIDVGQGDSTLIICDDKAMLIDAGNGSKGTTVQLYLTKQGIEKLDYVICTHPDSDHIGGMDVIITKYDCGCIYMPDIVADTKAYNELIDAIDYRGYSITVPCAGDCFMLGDAKCTVLGPVQANSSDNNNSIVIKVEYGECSFIICGDAECQEEQQIIDAGYDLSADVCHIGHHGSNTSSSSAWINAINPKFAVISCGVDNDYGHPHVETLVQLKNSGIEVYRTDEQGSIYLISDGKNVEWSCEPSASWNPGNSSSLTIDENDNSDTIIDENQDQTVDVDDAVTYVLNTNTKKFHKPSCSSVEDIKITNREDVTLTREQIIELGYEPCKRCNP